MNIDKAIAIPGWMEERELQWLAEQANAHKCIVEVGSYLGRSTRALADNTTGRVYVIDDWLGPRDVMLRPEDRQQIFDTFVRNMDGLQGKLNVIRTDHRKVQLDVCPDMVFIDGDHMYDAVAFDIQFWRKKIDIGGLLCGHDIDVPDVYAAVLEFLDEPLTIMGTRLWYTYLDSHPLYRPSAVTTPNS